MTNLQELEKKIGEIEERNRRVTIDKVWEISYTRRILLAAFTYLAIGFYLQVINVSQPWLNAIVPTVAFTLSTLTLPLLKNWWLKYVYKK